MELPPIEPPAQSMVFRAAVIAQSLMQQSVQGKRLLPDFRALTSAVGAPINILEDNAVENAPEMHRHEADLWFCLEGEVEFVHGGELVDGSMKRDKTGTPNPNEWTGTAIVGGVTATLVSGDWLWIPAGVPHQHCAAGVARLMIIKIPNG